MAIAYVSNVSNVSNVPTFTDHATVTPSHVRTHDRAIINVASGGWYPRGQARLMSSLAKFAPDWDRLAWTDPTQVGAPPHNVMPYAFKLHALAHATALGYTTLLWLDASMFAVAPLDALTAALDMNEFIAGDSGWNCGEWTHDRMLAYFGVTRETALSIPHCSSGCVGLRLDGRRGIGAEILSRWHASIPYFAGAWHNRARTESADPRCRGHRHDQAALSLILWQLGLRLTPDAATFVYKRAFDAGHVASLIAQGL